jgi:hypothetical protein
MVHWISWLADTNEKHQKWYLMNKKRIHCIEVSIQACVILDMLCTEEIKSLRYSGKVKTNCVCFYVVHLTVTTKYSIMRITHYSKWVWNVPQPTDETYYKHLNDEHNLIIINNLIIIPNKKLFGLLIADYLTKGDIL